MKTFVELIQKIESNCSRALKVKVKGNNITPYQLERLCMWIISQIRISKERERAMIFHSKCVNYLKAFSAIALKPGIKNYFKVPVNNESNHNITVITNTVTANLEYLISKNIVGNNFCRDRFFVGNNFHRLTKNL